MTTVSQSPNAIFMVRPKHFGFNAQTASSNTFQNSVALSSTEITVKAREEFDRFYHQLQLQGIRTFLFEENNPNTPDALFPNNWISFHPSGEVVLYPMLAENRRQEKRKDIVAAIEREFVVDAIFDMGFYEKEGKYLEGTGSIIFDYKNKVAYANRSPRTHDDLFYLICSELSFDPVLFTAVDKNKKDIYHTNVMMALADEFCVICLEAIDSAHRPDVKLKLMDTNHELINISYGQMEHFVGNMIQLSNINGEKFMVMSEAAHKALANSQIRLIEKYCGIIFSDLHTIETIGGGSARCMIAGIFLPSKST